MGDSQKPRVSIEADEKNSNILFWENKPKPSLVIKPRAIYFQDQESNIQLALALYKGLPYLEMSESPKTVSVHLFGDGGSHLNLMGRTVSEPQTYISNQHVGIRNSLDDSFVGMVYSNNELGIGTTDKDGETTWGVLPKEFTIKTGGSVIPQ